MIKFLYNRFVKIVTYQTYLMVLLQFTGFVLGKSGQNKNFGSISRNLATIIIKYIKYELFW